MNAKAPGIQHRIKTTLEIGRALRLVWQTTPAWALVNALLALLQSVMPLVSLYLIKRILDAVSESLQAAQPMTGFTAISGWVLLAAAAALLTAVLRSFSDYASQRQSLQMTDAVADIIHAKSIAVDLGYYEDPAYYDTLHRAQQEAPYRPQSIVRGLIQLGQNGLSLLGIVGLLFTFNGWLALILFIATIPGAVLRLVNSRRLYGFEQEQTEKERRAWYYHYVLTDSSHAKEIRLFDLGEFFKGSYHTLMEAIRTGRLKLALSRLGSDVFTQSLTTIALFGSLVWIILQVLNARITFGDLMVYYLGFQSGINFTQGVLHALAGLYEDNLFLNNLYQFLDLKPKISVPPKPRENIGEKPCRVDFENVSFTYNNRVGETLKEINLSLKPGSVIAIVGENGSGKSTLIKLLCRLYDPDRGVIRVNGVDIKEIDPRTWQREIAVVFQDYVRYAMTARDNIWLGDTKLDVDIKKIVEAGQSSGADGFIQNLPQGYDTMLGNWFENGRELSTGEWQKMSLARIFWRKASILILDEPTSSFDPLAELELFRHFQQELNGRSAILISHRYSTVQMADYIYVMDKGCMIEEGTHEDLLQQNGQYARLYHAQVQSFQAAVKNTPQI
jgi:ATP-binding cassette subfamily B protein